MLIDCDTCTARPRACGDCIVTHLLSVGPVRGSGAAERADPDRASTGAPAAPAAADPTELTDSEVAAVAVLSAGGLVPPLRLVPRGPAGRSRAG